MLLNTPFQEKHSSSAGREYSHYSSYPWRHFSALWW